MAAPAHFNEPPANAHDLSIVKGVLLSNGLTTLDPANGVSLPPERPSPYYHETKGPGIIAGCAVCIFVMLLVTLTRLGLRWRHSSLKFGIDDILIVPALLLAIAYPALQIAMVMYGGAGQHIYDVTYENFYAYHWIAASAQIDFFVCVGLIKMSIAVFNIRLTGMSGNRVWTFSNWTFFSLVLAYILVAFFINVFQCVPAIHSFDYIAIGKAGGEPQCIGTANMNTILRVINIVLDFCLLSVPIIVVWSLQMSLKKKLRIAAVFSFGGVACIGSLMALLAKFRLKTDALWNYTELLAWTLVELVFGMTTASLPALSVLLPGRGKSVAGHSTTPHTVGSTNITRHTGAMQSRHDADYKPYFGREDIGIMRQDDFEMSSMAASDVEVDAMQSSHALPGQKSATAHTRAMPRMDDTQPSRYGPLERHQK